MKIDHYTQEQLDAVQVYAQERIKVAASQNEAAAQLAVSPAHLMSFRDADWSKISQKSFNEMLARAGNNTWPHVPTDNADIIMSLCNQAQYGHKMLGLEGYTGAGKTHAMKVYTRRFPGTYYVMVDVTYSRWAFLNEVCQACGIAGDARGNTPSEMVASIAAKLRTADNPLLIIDDAGKASDDVFRLMQVIYDRTEHAAGIVLAGTEQLRVTLERKTRLKSKSFGEFYRRIAWWITLPPIGSKDVVAICTKNGIDDASAQKYLQRNTKDYGTLRHMVEGSKLIARNRGVDTVTSELLTDMNRGRDWHRGV